MVSRESEAFYLHNDIDNNNNNDNATTNPE